MSSLGKYYQVLRHLGLGFVWRRVKMKTDHALGMTRNRFASIPWESIDLTLMVRDDVPTDDGDYVDYKRNHAPKFLFPQGKPPAIPQYIREASGSSSMTLEERLDLLKDGTTLLFFHQPSGVPIDWYASPFNVGRGDAEKTWCDIHDFDPSVGDTRCLWESSRCVWAMDLARAKARGLEGADGALFWRWVDTWMNDCPPFNGFQWKCGQEASVRFLAIALGFQAFADDEETTAQRWTQFAKLAWATGYRVFHHIDYAISQRNNHAISEACGLLLVSYLFPEFREASLWGGKGRRVFADALRDQIYEDGSYIQHSMNYHRVMLQMSVLAIRLAELSGKPFVHNLYDCVERAAAFLFQMMDHDSGGVPNYGHNDGAYVWPMSECGFADYRPAVQAAHYLCTREKLFASGAWDEDLVWLFGDEAADAPCKNSEQVQIQKPVSSEFKSGGYYTLRGDDSWAMIRCHTYRDRPSQCDPLHVDLWWRGLNVLRDCGTYRYFAPDRPDIEQYYKSLQSHNTVEIDSEQPFENLSRFLWIPWPRTNEEYYIEDDDKRKWFMGRREDYNRSPWHVIHFRSIVSLKNDVWVIVDDLLGKGKHTGLLRWHLIDAPYDVAEEKQCITLNTEQGAFSLSVTCDSKSFQTFEVIKGRDEPGKFQGFESTIYGTQTPIPVVEMKCKGDLPLRMVTVVGPGKSAKAELVDRVEENISNGMRWNGERWRISVENHDTMIELTVPSYPSHLYSLNVIDE